MNRIKVGIVEVKHFLASSFHIWSFECLNECLTHHRNCQICIARRNLYSSFSIKCNKLTTVHWLIRVSSIKVVAGVVVEFG